MTRFSSSIAAALTLAWVMACGGDDKNSLVVNPDADLDASTGNGGNSNGGNSNGGNSNGGNSNGGSGGIEDMDASAPDASLNPTPDAAAGAGPGSNDAGADSGVTDGGESDAGDADAGPVCGNGDVEGTEGCDDGNTVSGDGCTADCWALELTQTVTVGPTLATAITDDAYAGTLVSMTCVDLVAGAWTGASISAVEVELGITHTWIGDLVIKLISPANTVVTLMSRPGLVEFADDGTSGVGEDSNLTSASPITFVQGAAASAENMGAGLTNGQTSCLSNAICEYSPNAGAATPLTLAAFNGQSSPGTWQLCVGDSGAVDTGTIDAVTLTIEH
jgi:cysteine-rich repeat protein